MKSIAFIKKLCLIIILLGVSKVQSLAQTGTTVDSALLDRITALEEQANYHKSGEDHFMMVGLTTFGFVNSKTTNSGVTTKANSFPDADNYEFSPMFLWRHENKFLMEFEPSFNNNGLSVNWADVSYFAAPNLIIRAGYFVLPFGTYAKREAAGWIDKLATDPMGIADMTPTDYGVEVEGGLPLGSMKMNYDVALTNGAQLNGDGTLTTGNITDNNMNKTVTARLGILPFSNSSLELGVSGMFGKVGNTGTAVSNAMGNSYAFDLNYVNNFSPILLNIKAQYNIQDITNETYDSSSVAGTQQLYTFNNHTTAGFAQCSIRPTGLSNFLKDVEVAGRYTSYNTPSNSTFGANQHTVTLGLDYWISWRTVAKFSYEIYNGNSTAGAGQNSGTTTSNTMFLQFSIQL